MTKKIRETKADLKKEIEKLTNKIDEKNEQLIAAGIIKRDTLISQIEEIENETRKTIKYIVSSCEKRTGREFNFCSLCNNNN